MLYNTVGKRHGEQRYNHSARRSGHRSLLLQQCTDVCRDDGALSLHRATHTRKKRREENKKEKERKESGVSRLYVNLNHDKLSGHPLYTAARLRE